MSLLPISKRGSLNTYSLNITNRALLDKVLLFIKCQYGVAKTVKVKNVRCAKYGPLCFDDEDISYDVVDLKYSNIKKNGCVYYADIDATLRFYPEIYNILNDLFTSKIIDITPLTVYLKELDKFDSTLTPKEVADKDIIINLISNLNTVANVELLNKTKASKLNEDSKYIYDKGLSNYKCLKEAVINKFIEDSKSKEK